MDTAKVIELFVSLTGQVKVYHWATTSYAAHKALDELHGTLSPLVDKFVESFIGRYKRQPLKVFTIESVATSDAVTSKIDGYLENERDKILALRKSIDKTGLELQSILDDMIIAIDNTLYLLKLK